MRRLFKIGMILISLLCIRTAVASADSHPFEFNLPPGTFISLPLDDLYQEYYNISCNVKDASNGGDDYNAIRIMSMYRPHLLTLDGNPDGNKDKWTIKTKMSGSNFSIHGVHQYDDKIRIQNLDFTDMLAFTCVAYLIER